MYVKFFYFLKDASNTQELHAKLQIYIEKMHRDLKLIQSWIVEQFPDNEQLPVFARVFEVMLVASKRWYIKILGPINRVDQPLLAVMMSLCFILQGSKDPVIHTGYRDRTAFTFRRHFFLNE
ncbi:hypothetical protein RF11_01942 [Thelohanellus kitauei]|uniref:Uncharacterized protein n=1 Tax=Thelohanellus kitauei TaxID=669202 RepID=A0A0C2NCA2_THEKT|nr:hypothetical protein RF11_01942 [Thelohanellus kitauei]